MNLITINDITVAYVEVGDTTGRSVVLVHGLAEDKNSWDGTQTDLAPIHTIAYDLRGHGDTTVGQGDATLAQLGNDLIGFLEKVTGPAVVVGFSLGGTIALWAAAERPDLVTQAVVLGTSSVVGRSAADFYTQRIALAADTSTPEFRAAVREDTAAALVCADDKLDVVTSARLRAVGDGAGYINASRAMAGLRDEPLTPMLPQVKVHVDVVGAQGDTFCPEKAARMILEALGDVTYWEIPDAGHLMNVDNPHAVTAVLRDAMGGGN